MNWRNHQKAVYCLFTNIEYPQQKFKGNCSKALLATRRSPSSGHFKSYEIKQREDNDAIDRSWMCVRGGGAVMNLVTLSNLKCCNKCYSNHLEELYWSCVLKAAPSQHLSQTHSQSQMLVSEMIALSLFIPGPWLSVAADSITWPWCPSIECSSCKFVLTESVLAMRMF